jgi:hypothetical protein
MFKKKSKLLEISEKTDIKLKTVTKNIKSLAVKSTDERILRLKKTYPADMATPESLLKEKAAVGRAQLISYLSGESINLREATRAKCFECMGFYADGIADCEQYRCPIYPFHPYNPNPARLRADKKKKE